MLVHQHLLKVLKLLDRLLHFKDLQSKVLSRFFFSNQWLYSLLFLEVFYNLQCPNQFHQGCICSNNCWYWLRNYLNLLQTWKPHPNGHSVLPLIKWLSYQQLSILKLQQLDNWLSRLLLFRHNLYLQKLKWRLKILCWHHLSLIVHRSFHWIHSKTLKVHEMLPKQVRQVHLELYCLMESYCLMELYYLKVME